uniref:LAM_G_DOMAIN domain-containing protein n=1 Tax=Macrostomum lignano TaxID=282301 RepID=A0A1I8J4Y8_9PLAT
MPDRTLLGSVISQLKFTEDLPSSLVVKYLELTPRHYYGDARLQFAVLAFPVGQVQISFSLHNMSYLTNVTVDVRLALGVDKGVVLFRVTGSPEEQTITVNNGTNRVWLNRTFAAKSGYLQANSSEIVSLSILNIYACASG